jgi:hypothetical protein
MPLGAPFSLVYAPGKSIYRRDAEFAEGIMGLVEYGGRSGRWFVHRVLAWCYFRPAVFWPSIELSGKGYAGRSARATLA